MGLILDSTVLVDAERSGQTAYQIVENMAGMDIALAVSVVTVLELAHGVAPAETEKRRATRQRFLDDLLRGMPIYPVTIPVALRAGKLDGSLSSRGHRVALGDLLIGATALELGYHVATHNARHLAEIPDLIVRSL